MTITRFVTASLAALLAGLVYLNALDNPFVYDDYHTVVANPSIHSVANLKAIVLYDMTRPIVNFSYAADRALWDAGPVGFHVTNVLLHVLNAVLLFQLAWKLAEDVRLPSTLRQAQGRPELRRGTTPLRPGKPDATYDLAGRPDATDKSDSAGPDATYDLADGPDATDESDSAKPDARYASNGDSRQSAGVVAFGAAALFAVHPMMTEAVGYISGRSEVLCATFFLLAFLCGRRWLHGDGRRWTWLTVGLWMAALATKEVGAMFPFVLLGYDWLTHVRLQPDATSEDRKPVREATSHRGGHSLAWRRRLLTIHLPLIGVALIGGIVRVAVLAFIEYPGQVRIHWSYLLIGADVARQYLWLMLRPVGQTIFHEVIPASGLADPGALLALGSMGLVAALIWRARRLQALVSFGLLWFLLALVPSTVLIALNQGEPMAEHRVYLASCGVLLAVGAAIGRLANWLTDASVWLRLSARVALFIVLLSFGAQTVLRNMVWADPVALWRESSELAPTHYRPRLLLGEALQDAGRPDEAIVEFQTAIRLRPTDPTGYIKLGGSLARMGQLAAARQHFLEALRVDPQNELAREAMAILDKVEAGTISNGSRR